MNSEKTIVRQIRLGGSGKKLPCTVENIKRVNCIQYGANSHPSMQTLQAVIAQPPDDKGELPHEYIHLDTQEEIWAMRPVSGAALRAIVELIEAVTEQKFTKVVLVVHENGWRSEYYFREDFADVISTWEKTEAP